jgi:Xaa-Pro aminopeptidase
MKYHQIDRDLFIKNRNKFMAQMKKSVAVLTLMIFINRLTARCHLSRAAIFFTKRRGSENILLLFPDAPMNTKRNIISKRNKRP